MTAMLDPMVRAMDLFCGAGGSSTGMMQACDDAGVKLRLAAVNHWEIAIATHSANHPEAKHFCVDVDHARMDQLAPDGVDILWGSPSCTEHSYAKGGKSIDDQKRASAWVMPRAVEAWKPKIVIVENVRNMLKWGPVEPVLDRKTKQPKIGKDGKVIIRPIKSKAGETFRAWFSAIESLGYEGKWELLNAADYGEAQTRLRLFIVFTRIGYRFSYPAPSHGKPDTLAVARGLLRPWKAAREIINFDLESKSIFSRETPLSPNTMRRIEAGIVRYCSGPIAEAFLVILRKNADAQDLADPTPTLTTSGGQMWLAEPEIRPFVCGNRTNNVPKDLDVPLGSATTTTGGGFFLAEPEAFTLNHGDGGSVARSVNKDPIPTVRACGGGSVVEPMIVEVNHTGEREPRLTNEPLGTLTRKNGFGVAQPFFATYYGEQGNGPRTDSVDEPIPTVPCDNRFAIVEPFVLVPGDDTPIRSIDEPFDGDAIEPFIVPQDTGARNLGMHEPISTVRTTSRGIRFVTPFLTAHFGERPGQEPRTHDVASPLPTVTHRGAGDLVMVEVWDEEGNPVTGYLIEIEGKRYVIDIKFRMLQPEELARAQGFPDDYEFTGTKEARTAQIGNAVCVGVAKALMREALRAIFPDEIRAAA